MTAITDEGSRRLPKCLKTVNLLTSVNERTSSSKLHHYAIQVPGCATLHHNCTILTSLLLCRKCHASSQSHLECSTSIGPHHPHYRGGAGGGVRTMTTVILHCLAYLKSILLLSCFSYDISCSSSLWQQKEVCVCI